MKMLFPMLAAGAAFMHASAFAADASRPQIIEFGASVASMEAALSARCLTQSKRETEPFLPAHKTQMQIDCEGFDYFGGAHKAEFIFGDDRLIIVWILTGEEVEDALDRAFRKSFGEPTHISADFVAFADNNTAIRKEPAEVLFYGDEVADAFRGWFDSQTAN
ncbi:MAG: hypothetical protein R3C60_04565 [Parvularculaceae bacterium]